MHYIVGDVTIELARILEKTAPGQVMVGAFSAHPDDSHGSLDFVRACNSHTSGLEGMALMGRPLRKLSCWLTRDASDSSDDQPLDVSVTDKHGFQHHAFNLQAELELEDSSLSLGITPEQMQLDRPAPRAVGDPRSDH